MIADAAFADGAKPEIPIAVGIPGDEEESFCAGPAGADGERPLGAACWGNIPAAVGDGEPEFFWSRFWGNPGDFFEGTVLLRWIPPLCVWLKETPYAGLAGLGAPFD